MIIESMELQNYRNYPSLQVEFDPGTNIFYGDNAQGKTNALEAMYVCCTTKSHRASRDRELIRFDQEEAHIKLQIRKENVPYRIDMHLKKNKPKGVAVNGIPIRKVSELFGIANVVFFSPEDLHIIKNGPSERRRFLDLELCQVNKLYVHALVHYNKSLLQRNRLLKDLSFRPEYESTLEIWDEQLVRYGLPLMEYRKQFIEQLNVLIEGIHGKLTGNKEVLHLNYEPNVQPKEFASALKRNRESEKRQKTTLSGPHRDDICFSINQMDIRRFGSQGQQRSAALSLKLSEIELVKQLVHDYPILLLDDVLSELDSGRQNHLLNSINHIQTMITCTGLDEFIGHRFSLDRIFNVTDGTVCREN